MPLAQFTQHPKDGVEANISCKKPDAFGITVTGLHILYKMGN